MTVMAVEFTARCDSCSNSDAVWLAQRTPLGAMAAAYGGSFTELQPMVHTYPITCEGVGCATF